MSGGERFWRQLDVVPLDAVRQASATIVGCGATGSWTALTLAKIGLGRIVLYDADTVDEHNIPNQVFGEKDKDVPKSLALAQHLRQLAAHTKVFAYNKHFTRQDEADTTLVVSCVDSMASRKIIWQACKAQTFQPQLYVDPRMSVDSFLVYTAVGMDPSYEASLHDDAQGEEPACTAWATSFGALGVASIVGALVAAFLRNEELPKRLSMDLRNFHLSGGPLDAILRPQRAA